jgi:vancomycin permeability regulator SanA
MLARVERILLSGDHMAPEYDETGRDEGLLDHGRGPRKTRLIVDQSGFDTYESGARAKHIFHLTRLTVVTQDYHLVRGRRYLSFAGR